MKEDNSTNYFCTQMNGMMKDAKIRLAQADGTSTGNANINNVLSTLTTAATLLVDDYI